MLKKLLLVIAILALLMVVLLKTGVIKPTSFEFEEE